ncbi:MAG: HlyC/CorC family transporter [Clostridiaceae bacterium]|nr:HlyC/CorC family transporter [Clostridiaceae bacterium]
MDPHILGQLFILGGLLCLSAFFSASETALTSLSKIRIRHMVDEGIKGATLVNRLTENPSRLLGTILVGNNAVNIGASALATSLALHFFGSSGIGIATLVTTILVLIFCEITPKYLAAQFSESIALKVAKPISIIITVLNPIVIIFTRISNIFIRIFGGTPDKAKPFITEEELKTIVSVGQEEGVLEVEETQMINNVFEFGDLHAKDVMTQRTDIVAISINASYNELVELIKEEQFSRIPIYNETIDNIVGILYVKDLIPIEDAQKDFNIKKYMREPFFTFEYQKITRLFKQMKKNRSHMAIVLDEYGGTAGIVTLEDLIEEIVGDIEDEYDENEDEIVVIKEGEYVVLGSTKIDVLNHLIGTKFYSEVFDSIGGFIIGELGRFPKQGEQLEYDGIKIVIEEINKNRIEKVKILTK